MSNNYETPISEYIKQGVFIIIIIAIALVGIKSCRKYQKKQDIVLELSSLAGESAAYEQFYTESAQENLLQAMYQIYLGTELGLAPSEIIEKVMRSKEEFFSDSEDTGLTIRKQLIRDALLSNFDNCLKLGLFDSDINLSALANGDMPIINSGPANGEEIVILPIIPPLALPGSDKLLPNMSISPPPSAHQTSTETLIQRARAKRLLQSFAEAGLIERDAYKKVLQHYEQNSLIKPVK